MFLHRSTIPIFLDCRTRCSAGNDRPPGMCAPIPPPTARSIRPECSKPCAPVNDELIPKAPECIVPVALGSSHEPVSFRSSKVLGNRSLALNPSVVHRLAEAVLVILLFNDASTVRLAEFRAESDAGLGEATGVQPGGPLRVRSVLNLESGLITRRVGCRGGVVHYRPSRGARHHQVDSAVQRGHSRLEW